MVDYRFSTSLHIMLALAYRSRRNPEKLVSSSDLATSTKSNPTLIRQLLVPLNEAGLIKTYRGKSGGVALAKDARDVSLREIYEASFSSKLMLSRGMGYEGCPIGSNIHCVFDHVLGEMEGVLMKHLEGKNLLDLLESFIE
ncbi:RrF2 family transcriptional regulator [Marinomonas foliarum]|jgi:Rrf2 family protein|uniref:Rrf2 family protein n=1 Tax=Marinomonas foliarum TaxID=491950 RepID=A0A369A5T7_9GAMM|nr:Rrf2 family transcriptional regulator [Marinomonas foliarum]QRV25288.1 Rrf2 family transcriptional regulator [Marinomonas foliarum]RCX04700.1 Rrf2 family protein [Marinomonas foliarum]